MSGLFVRDSDSLFGLRASDGNFASLDVTLSAAYVASSLEGKIISFQYHDNRSIVEPLKPTVDANETKEAQIDQVSEPAPAKPEASSSQSRTTPRLTLEQKIALGAKFEDPFSISSRSCFEDDDDDEDGEPEEDESDSKSDVDDDLYSDDGEMLMEDDSEWSSHSSGSVDALGVRSNIFLCFISRPHLSLHCPDPLFARTMV